MIQKPFSTKTKRLSKSNNELERMDVIKGLWDSWEDGAFIYDKESGVFFDRKQWN